MKASEFNFRGLDNLTSQGYLPLLSEANAVGETFNLSADYPAVHLSEIAFIALYNSSLAIGLIDNLTG